ERPREAIPFARLAREARQDLERDLRRLPEYKDDLARTRLLMGNDLRAEGDLVEAERAYREALEDYGELTAASPQVTRYQAGLAEAHSRLGNLLLEPGRHADAGKAYAKGLPLLEQLAAEAPKVPAHRETLAGARANYALVLQATGRPREAEETS